MLSRRTLIWSGPFTPSAFRIPKLRKHNVSRRLLHAYPIRQALMPTAQRSSQCEIYYLMSPPPSTGIPNSGFLSIPLQFTAHGGRTVYCPSSRRNSNQPISARREIIKPHLRRPDRSFVHLPAPVPMAYLHHSNAQVDNDHFFSRNPQELLDLMNHRQAMEVDSITAPGMEARSAARSCTTCSKAKAKCVRQAGDRSCER